MRAQYCTLEASVERAGRALGCLHSGAEEFEAAVIRARRGPIYGRFGVVTQTQVVLSATAIAAAAMLVAMFV